MKLLKFLVNSTQTSVSFLLVLAPPCSHLLLLMSSRIQFYPVFGCNPFEPRCFILKIDEFRLLLDCGWDARFEEKDIEALKCQDLTNIDAVLISQPDLAHIGALPYAYAKLGLTAPILATAPVWRMGQYMLMDAFVSIHQTHANFNLFSHEDIKKVFKKQFKSKLKYCQEYPLVKEIKNDKIDKIEKIEKIDNKEQEEEQPKTRKRRRIGNSNTILSSSLKSNNNDINSVSLIVTPYAAGHMVGGTIWKISKETDNIIYSIDYNIRREKHLNESVFGIMEIRPSLLITDCITIGQQFIVKRKQRENQLYNKCMSTLKNGGNVLIPSDSAGRCLELLLTLYGSFQKHKDFNNYHLVFLSYTSKNTLNSAKSMLEWMAETCQKELNKNQKNVFEFKELLICQTIQEFKSCIKYPYVCIATNESLECGFSQQLFIDLSQHSSNQILLTQRSAPGTLASKLIDIINDDGNKNRNVQFEKYRKQRLSDKEKIEYLEKQKQKELKEKEKERQEKQNAISFRDNDDDDNKLMDIDMENNNNNDDVDNEPLNKISKSNTKSMDIDIIDSNDVVFDPSLNKRIKMTSVYDMYQWNDNEQEIIMTDYGMEIDLNQFRSEPSKKKKKSNMSDEEEDEFQSISRSHSLSPSPNDIVNQTMSLIPSNVLNPDPMEPFKTVKEIKKIHIKCLLHFLNIEGRSDEESIKQTLPTLQPRQMILVHGSNYQKHTFKDFCMKEKICSDIMIAQNLKWTKVKTNTKYKKIIMDDIIERSLKFYNINGYDVAYLNGKLQEIDKEEMDIDIGDIKNKNMIDDIQYKLSKSTEKTQDIDDIMDETTDDINKITINFPSNDGHSLSYLGDVTKIEMETSLKQNNVPAELYHGGTLVAGKSGEVRITHKNAQKTVLSINATLTNDYFNIRDRITDQYHLV